MKVSELFEGRFRGNGYELGNYPTSRDKGLYFLYETVLPNLAKTFKIPVTNIKVQSDHGFGWSTAKNMNRPFSSERCLMRVEPRKKAIDFDMLTRLFPMALKHELSKRLRDVEVKVIEISEEKYINLGTETRFPPFMILGFTTKYPQEWLDFDKQRYNITW